MAMSSFSVMRVFRLMSRHSRGYGVVAGQFSRHVSFDCLQRCLWLGHPAGRALCAGGLRACYRHPSRPLSDEADESAAVLDEMDELDRIRVHLYPDSDDHVLKALGRTTSVGEVFAGLGDSEEPRHLCQAVASLWDVHKLGERPGPLPAGDYGRLVAALLRRAGACDDLGLVCALYSVGRLDEPGTADALRHLEEHCMLRLPRLSLPALSRLGVCLHKRNTPRLWPPRLVQSYLRALAAHTAACHSWEQLRLLATAFVSALPYVSFEAERRFVALVHQFILEREARPEDASAIYKVFRAFDSRGALQLLSPVYNDLASLLVRAEPRPSAEVTAHLGEMMLMTAEASPVVERLLSERAAALVAPAGPRSPLELRLLDVAAPHHILPGWLTKAMLRTAQSRLQTLNDNLGSASLLTDRTSQLELLSEIQLVQRLLHDVRPLQTAELDQLWRLCLRALQLPIQSADAADWVARRLASVYLYHVATLGPAGGLRALERALRDRLALQSRHELGVRRLMELLAFLLACGGRPLPADRLDLLLRLAEHDQLSPYLVLKLSEAIKTGRTQAQRMRKPFFTECLHQLTQLTIALNSTTVRLLPKVTHVDHVVRLATAVLRRRGVVRGNTVVLEAVLARFHQLAEAPQVQCGQLTTSGVERLAACLEAVQYSDHTAMGHCCRHIVSRRDHVSGTVAERVLSAAFSTGYWPPDSPLFDDFLVASANIVCRSLYRMTAERTLRACQALCLYGQLPVQLARTVLGQAFLDKTEREIQHLAEHTGSRVGSATRLRRLQMEVNRAIRLNMPDQNVPWFTDVYAKGLPDPLMGAAHRRLVSEVNDTLAALAGGEDRVHCGVRTAGYQFTAELVVHRLPDGTYTDTDGPRVISTAVLVPSTKDYCINTPRLTGSQLLRRRHLEMLGFTVRTVHPHHWNSMALAEPADKLSFLAALMDGRNLLEERA